MSLSYDSYVQVVQYIKSELMGAVQNPETQNPDRPKSRNSKSRNPKSRQVQNPDRFKILTGSKSRQVKIPTGSKSRQVKIPTGQNPDISLAAKFQYTCVTQSVLYLFIHNIFAPTLSTTLSTIKTL